MGVWCSEGCNPNPKEISARVKMKVTVISIFYKKSNFLAQKKFFLLTGAFYTNLTSNIE
jgi:hypothetical protein